MKSFDTKVIQSYVEKEIQCLNQVMCDAIATWGCSQSHQFSKFLQAHNLIYANVNEKLTELQSSLQQIKENDSQLFKMHIVPFLQSALENMTWADDYATIL